MHPVKPSPILTLSGITKRFGALVASDAIDLDLGRGEVLALLGENGAGKTTLMNILFGHYVADAGEIRVAAQGGEMKLLRSGSPQAALDAGIGMVQQHFALADSLTVLENIVLGTRSLASPTLRRREARAKLERLMRDTGLVVDPGERVSRLAVGERQRVEILKVLYRGARVLVLDEPTAVLTPKEADGLFDVLRRLKATGLAVIFISHKLREVLAIADRVAVLRAGRKVADVSADGTDRNTLASLMVGRDIPMSRRDAGTAGAPALVLDRVTVPGTAGRVGLHDASLSVRQREIVGIAGVSGNGQSALAALIAGMAPAGAGSATLFGVPLTASPRAAVRAGIARIPEDRHHEGIVGSLTIAENLVIENLRDPNVQKWGLLRFGSVREQARAAIAAFDVRCPGPDAPIRLLSGGNIQKVILARGLGREPRLVLANQPTRGLDVGATADVHRRLLEARARGAAIVLISEDLDELLALSDRIAVMNRGHLTSAEPVETLSLERLGLLMAGQGGETRAA
jgi:general nucleoside transport system ATP-binding protein